jgi:hypothetical protein
MQRRKNRLLTPAQWSEHITSHVTSKQSLIAYCQQHGLVIATFRHWRHKLKPKPALAKPPTTLPALVPVKIVSSTHAPMIEPALMSVLLPNGARIEMRVTEASFPWVLKQVGALP